MMQLCSVYCTGMHHEKSADRTSLCSARRLIGRIRGMYIVTESLVGARNPRQSLVYQGYEKGKTKQQGEIVLYIYETGEWG